MNTLKITHLTSAHPRYDTRIFVKECCSLAKVSHYHVSLVVADGKGDEHINGVDIIDIGVPSGGRISRMTTTTKKVFLKAKELNSTLYHLHDPELIPVGIKLKKLGKKVIFDIHEDVPKQILAKPYLNTFTKQIISTLYASYEKRASRRFDALVTPTPTINRRFKQINPRSVEVANYPIIEELSNTTLWQERENRLCHIGSLAESRGVIEIVDALAYSHLPLDLCGNFRPQSLQDKAQASEGWSYVDFHGFISRDEVNTILKQVKIGLVTLHPTPSYLEAIPVKMFEYMAAGVAVIASDFPIYRELLQGYECALFVDPLDPKAIADASKQLMQDQSKMEQMGKIGKTAVMQKFNWAQEEQKLYELYRELLS